MTKILMDLFEEKIISTREDEGKRKIKGTIRVPCRVCGRMTICDAPIRYRLCAKCKAKGIKID